MTLWEDSFTEKAAPLLSGGFSVSGADVVVVGAGIIGASTAISLAEANRGLNIAVVDRTFPPRGATLRNAGFSCFGSLSEVAGDVDLHGADVAVDVVRMRVEGLALLRNRIDDNDVDYLEDDGFEIFLEEHPALERIDEMNALLEPLFHAAVYERTDDRISSHGLSPNVHALVRTRFEGTLNSGKMLAALWRRAADLGVKFYQSEVTDIDALKPAHVVLATNALWSRPSTSGPLLSPSLFGRTLVPARGQILVTKPLANVKLRGSYHMDEGFVYFRTVGNRVLLGGGRNKAFDEEATDSQEVTNRIQLYLEDLLRTVILPGHDIEIDRRWAGTMGFSADKRPFVGEVAPGVIRAFGCNGMGVAIGSLISQQAAEAVLALR